MLLEKYKLLQLFLKLRDNLLKCRKDFLCEDFFLAELDAINGEITKLRAEIKALN